MTTDMPNGRGAVKKTTTYKLVSLFLTVVVLGVVIHEGPRLKNELQKVDLLWALAGLGCYFVNYLLRALRIRTISKGRVGFWPEALHAACLHGFASYLLPVRSGDLTLPVILKKVSDMSLFEGGRLLVKARLLDISIMGFWIICAVLLTSIQIQLSLRIVWLIMGIALCMIPLMIKWIASVGVNRSKGFFKRIVSLGNVGSFAWQEIFESLGIWFAVGSCFYCTVKAVGLSLGIGEVWFIISINLPLQLIPIQGFANAGNHEGGWVGALLLLGMSTDEGLRFALTSHALLLSYVLLLWPLAALGQVKSTKIN